MLSRSALRAIVDGRQSAHTGIPIVLEERAMPMIVWIFTSLQTLPSMMFIFFIFWFILAALPMLVFIFLE
jgi:ABC-type proline/glycine betaine transport system permease subunit